MRLRFLQTTPSSNPEFPFQPGQVIYVTKLTAEMREWLTPTGESGPLAEIVKDEPERAIAPAADQPEPGKRRRRE